MTPVSWVVNVCLFTTINHMTGTATCYCCDANHGVTIATHDNESNHLCCILRALTVLPRFHSCRRAFVLFDFSLTLILIWLLF